MARYTNYFGKPIYRVSFTRTDEPGLDLLYIAAWSKVEAAAGTRQMYRDRVRSIRRITRERAS